ncbi:hypothetical protein C8R46DRAFT_1047550 [Mycena filopes]|nr:hypothetical protein C8R46DRAFT_1047550 [Mycena filopes]
MPPTPLWSPNLPWLTSVALTDAEEILSSYQHIPAPVSWAHYTEFMKTLACPLPHDAAYLSLLGPLSDFKPGGVTDMLLEHIFPVLVFDHLLFYAPGRIFSDPPPHILLADHQNATFVSKTARVRAWAATVKAGVNTVIKHCERDAPSPGMGKHFLDVLRSSQLDPKGSVATIHENFKTAAIALSLHLAGLKSGAAREEKPTWDLKTCSPSFSIAEAKGLYLPRNEIAATIVDPYSFTPLAVVITLGPLSLWSATRATNSNRFHELSLELYKVKAILPLSHLMLTLPQYWRGIGNAHCCGADNTFRKLEGAMWKALLEGAANSENCDQIITRLAFTEPFVSFQPQHAANPTLPPPLLKATAPLPPPPPGQAAAPLPPSADDLLTFSDDDDDMEDMSPHPNSPPAEDHRAGAGFTPSSTKRPRGDEQEDEAPDSGAEGKEKKKPRVGASDPLPANKMETRSMASGAAASSSGAKTAATQVSTTAQKRKRKAPKRPKHVEQRLLYVLAPQRLPPQSGEERFLSSKISTLLKKPAEPEAEPLLLRVPERQADSTFTFKSINYAVFAAAPHDREMLSKVFHHGPGDQPRIGLPNAANPDAKLGPGGSSIFHTTRSKFDALSPEQQSAIFEKRCIAIYPDTPLTEEPFSKETLHSLQGMQDLGSCTFEDFDSIRRGIPNVVSALDPADAQRLTENPPGWLAIATHQEALHPTSFFLPPRHIPQGDLVWNGASSAGAKTADGFDVFGTWFRIHSGFQIMGLGIPKPGHELNSRLHTANGWDIGKDNEDLWESFVLPAGVDLRARTTSPSPPVNCITAKRYLHSAATIGDSVAVLAHVLATGSGASNTDRTDNAWLCNRVFCYQVCELVRDATPRLHVPDLQSPRAVYDLLLSRSLAVLFPSFQIYTYDADAERDAPLSLSYEDLSETALGWDSARTLDKHLDKYWDLVATRNDEVSKTFTALAQTCLLHFACCLVIYTAVFEQRDPDSAITVASVKRHVRRALAAYDHFTRIQEPLPSPRWKQVPQGELDMCCALVRDFDLQLGKAYDEADKEDLPADDVAPFFLPWAPGEQSFCLVRKRR